MFRLQHKFNNIFETTQLNDRLPIFQHSKMFWLQHKFNNIFETTQLNNDQMPEFYCHRECSKCSPPAHFLKVFDFLMFGDTPILVLWICFVRPNHTGSTNNLDQINSLPRCMKRIQSTAAACFESAIATHCENLKRRSSFLPEVKNKKRRYPKSWIVIALQLRRFPDEIIKNLSPKVVSLQQKIR